VLIDAVPSSPAPAPPPATPAPGAQDLDALVAFSPDPDPLPDSSVARIDDDPPVRSAFARQAYKPRRIARWSGALLVLLALLFIGMDEFHLELQAGRVLDVLGFSRGTGAGESAAVSASPAGPAAPVIPPIATDAGAAKPMPTEPTAADSPKNATAPASPASAPIAADAGGAKPMPTEPTAADSPASATAPASPAGPNRATPAAAATAAPAEPAEVAQPAPTPPPTRVTQQHVSRAPASPREACGPRTQFSLYRCMQTQCSQRRWASHAQCQRLRATDSVD
jgi:hypothetical protein